MWVSLRKRTRRPDGQPPMDTAAAPGEPPGGEPAVGEPAARQPTRPVNGAAGGPARADAGRDAAHADGDMDA